MSAAPKTIPPKGTKARAVLDYLYAHVTENSGRGISTIKTGVGNISDAALQEVISIARKNGWLIVRGRNGYAVSTTARKQIAQELEAALQANHEYAMKPLGKEHIPSPLGMREGSNDHRAWPSKFVN
jgi:hypothetical protein